MYSTSSVDRYAGDRSRKKMRNKPCKEDCTNYFSFLEWTPISTDFVDTVWYRVFGGIDLWTLYFRSSYAAEWHLDKLYTLQSATLRNDCNYTHRVKSNQALKSGSQSESSSLSSLSIFRFRFFWDFFLLLLLLLLLFSPLGDLGVLTDFDRGVLIGVAGAPINAKPAIMGAGVPKIGMPIGPSVGTGDSVTWYVRMAEASLSSSSSSAGSILSMSCLNSIYFSTRDCLLDTST